MFHDSSSCSGHHVGRRWDSLWKGFVVVHDCPLDGCSCSMMIRKNELYLEILLKSVEYLPHYQSVMCYNRRLVFTDTLLFRTQLIRKECSDDDADNGYLPLCVLRGITRKARGRMVYTNLSIQWD